MTTITLRQGQQVSWPRSPSGMAQVEHLRRSNVTLLYRRWNRICRAVVPVRRIAAIQATAQLLPGFELPANVLERGIVGGGRVKTFEVRR